MPTLLDNDQRAGNEADEHDKAQQSFDDIVGHLKDVEAEGNQIIDDHENGTHVDDHGDEVQDNYNSDGPDLNSEEKNQDKAPDPLGNNDEGGGGFRARFGRAFKKNGASASIIALLVGGSFFGSSVLLGPAALITVLEKVLTNHNSNDTRATIMMRRAYVGGLLSKSNSTSKVGKVFTSISETQKANWEKNGFRMTGDSIDGRFKPTAIICPDGTRATTGTAFDNHAKYNLDARKAANLVLNPRASTFTKPTSKLKAKIYSKWGVSIDNKMRGSPSKDKAERTAAMDSDFNSRTGAGDSNDRQSLIDKAKTGIKNSKAKAAIDKYSGKISKATNIADIASFGCTAYALVKTSIAGVKLYYYQELIRFMMPWLQLAAQVQTYGDVDPELMEYAMDRLTWYNNDKSAPDYNKSAFDSNGLRSALYGDFDKLTEQAKNYTSWYMVAAVAGNGITQKAEEYLGGKENIQTFCATARAASLAGSVFCLSNPLSAGICLAAIATLSAFGDDIVEYVSGELIEDAVKIIADANLTSNLKGVPLGDAISSAVGLLLLQKSQGAGMQMATSAAAVGTFISATNDDYYRYVDEIAMDDARNNPFDATNQYSFISQLSVGVNHYTQANAPLFGNLANLFSVSTSTFSSLFNPNANALYSQPNELTRRPEYIQASLSRCEDQELKDIGVVCEWQGKPIGVISGAVLGKAVAQANGDTSMIEQTIEYMRGANPENTEYIKEDGSTIGSGDDNEYTMFKAYCTEDREFPFGTSDFDYGEMTGPDTKLAWGIGARCAGNNADGTPGDTNLKTMLDHFFIYYHMCETQVALADDVENCSNTQSLAAVTPNTGDWVIPTSGPCTSPYGPRWGSMHQGIDIAPSEGTDIVAPTSMRILEANTSGYGGGYGTFVIAEATDGSGNGFLFGHMIEGSNSHLSAGQEVSKGDVIGKVGNTGHSYGAHLHFNIYPQGVDPRMYSGEIDPVPVLGQHGVSISC